MSDNLTNRKTASQIRFNVLMDELDARQRSFKREAGIRLHVLDSRLEKLKHNALIAKYDLDRDIAFGFKKMLRAASSIILPEDAI